MCETTCHVVAHLRFTPRGVMTRREVLFLCRLCYLFFLSLLVIAAFLLLLFFQHHNLKRISGMQKI